MVVIVVFGFPGAGKSYISRLMGHRGCRVLEGDDFLPPPMRDLILRAAPVPDFLRDEYFQSLYRAVAQALAETPLSVPLVISQTFMLRQHRLDFLRRFPMTHFVLVVCEEGERRVRLERRSSSEGLRLETNYAQKMCTRFDAPTFPHFYIRNEVGSDVEAQVDDVLRRASSPEDIQRLLEGLYGGDQTSATDTRGYCERWLCSLVHNPNVNTIPCALAVARRQSSPEEIRMGAVIFATNVVRYNSGAASEEMMWEAVETATLWGAADVPERRLWLRLAEMCFESAPLPQDSTAARASHPDWLRRCPSVGLEFLHCVLKRLKAAGIAIGSFINPEALAPFSAEATSAVLRVLSLGNTYRPDVVVYLTSPTYVHGLRSNPSAQVALHYINDSVSECGPPHTDFIAFCVEWFSREATHLDGEVLSVLVQLLGHPRIILPEGGLQEVQQALSTLLSEDPDLTLDQHTKPLLEKLRPALQSVTSFNDAEIFVKIWTLLVSSESEIESFFEVHVAGRLSCSAAAWGYVHQHRRVIARRLPRVHSVVQETARALLSKPDALPLSAAALVVQELDMTLTPSDNLLLSCVVDVCRACQGDFDLGTGVAQALHRAVKGASLEVLRACGPSLLEMVTLPTPNPSCLHYLYECLALAVRCLGLSNETYQTLVRIAENDDSAVPYVLQLLSQHPAVLSLMSRHPEWASLRGSRAAIRFVLSRWSTFPPEATEDVALVVCVLLRNGFRVSLVQCLSNLMRSAARATMEDCVRMSVATLGHALDTPVDTREPKTLHHTTLAAVDGFCAECVGLLDPARVAGMTGLGPLLQLLLSHPEWEISEAVRCVQAVFEAGAGDLRSSSGNKVWSLPVSCEKDEEEEDDQPGECVGYQNTFAPLASCVY